MKEARRIELNITREQAAAFIDFLANEGYWGQTETYFDINHGAERVAFIINGHELSNVSNQQRQVVIDNCYCHAGGVSGINENGVEYTPIGYCLKKLGF